jgi:cell division septal protein FtsQ
MAVKIGKNRPQRPAARGRKFAGRGGEKGRWRSYLPALLTLFLGVLALAAVGVLYHAATSSSFFRARDIMVSGTVRTSADEVRAIAQRQLAVSGVWHADLEALSAEINRLPWVHQAVVSRVLPDGLRVAVKERTKTAVILAANGKPAWVDEEGVKLGPVGPSDKFSLLLKGWNEQGAPEADAENKQRMAAFKQMLSEWDAAGLTKNLSEVALNDVRDVRVALRSRPEVEILLGDRNFGTRLHDAMQTLDSEKRTDVVTLNAKMDDHVIITYRDPVATPAATGERTRPAASPTPNASPKPKPARR